MRDYGKMIFRKNELKKEIRLILKFVTYQNSRKAIIDLPSVYVNNA